MRALISFLAAVSLGATTAAGPALPGAGRLPPTALRPAVRNTLGEIVEAGLVRLGAATPAGEVEDKLFRGPSLHAPLGKAWSVQRVGNERQGLGDA